MQPVGEKQIYNIFTNERNRLICPTEVRKMLLKLFSYATTEPVIICLVNLCKMSWMLRKSGCDRIWDLLSCVFQEHPYIFTRVNSLPVFSTASPTTSPSVAPTADLPIKPDNSGKVPAWLAAVLSATGLVVGCAVTWLFFFCRAKRSKKRMPSKVEIKATGL